MNIFNKLQPVENGPTSSPYDVIPNKYENWPSPETAELLAEVIS